MTGLNIRTTALLGRLINPAQRVLVERVCGIRVYSEGKNTGQSFNIRGITELDIPRISEVRKTLKIHDCLSTLYTFHKLDPEAIIVTEDDQGRIIGTHMILNFAKDLYSSGLTYVQPNYRHHKLAETMVFKAKVRHEKGVLVSHTFEAWAKKVKDHPEFGMQTGFTICRHVATENIDCNLLSDKLPEGVTIQPLKEEDFELLYQYDLELIGYERRRYLELSCKEKNSKTLLAMQNGRCVGYGAVKLSCPGAKRIGPLYADDPKTAEALLKSLLQGFQDGKGIAITIISSNSVAEEWVERLKIPLNDRLYQIYTQQLPDVDVRKVFAHFDLNGTSI